MRTSTLAVTPIQIRANAFDLLSRIADELAHEIKNPIHSAVINAELVRRRVQTGDAALALERLGILEQEIDRAHALMDGLLRLLRPARTEAGTFEPDEVLSELVPLLTRVAAHARVEFRCELGAGGIETHGYAPVIRHAVLNVFVNALDAIGTGTGTIVLESFATPGEVAIRIRDTGPGVPADAACRIGEPGFTTRPGHAGLGLAVAGVFLEAAGGRVVLEGPGGDDGGAAFVLALPRSTAA